MCVHDIMKCNANDCTNKANTLLVTQYDQQDFETKQRFCSGHAQQIENNETTSVKILTL